MHWPPKGIQNPYYLDDTVCLVNADCLDVMREMEAGSVDMICTDPPYGMNRFATDGKDYLEAVAPALRLSWDILKDCSSMFVFTSTGEVVKVANGLGQPLKRMFWMYKPGDCTYPLGGWLLTSEAILWFAKGDKLNLCERKPYRHDCYIHKRVGLEGVEGHPCVKPLWVVSDLVSRCPEGGTVLDMYCGSGTTGVACVKTGRRFIGVEISEEYTRIALKRILEAKAQLQLGFNG